MSTVSLFIGPPSMSGNVSFGSQRWLRMVEIAMDRTRFEVRDHEVGTRVDVEGRACYRDGNFETPGVEVAC